MGCILYKKNIKKSIFGLFCFRSFLLVRKSSAKREHETSAKKKEREITWQLNLEPVLSGVCLARDRSQSGRKIQNYWIGRFTKKRNERGCHTDHSKEVGVECFLDQLHEKNKNKK